MKDFLSSLLALWKQLGLNQRVSLVVAGLAVVGVLIGLTVWSRRPDLQLLYGRLSEKDAATIVSQLQAQGIAHKVSAGGGTIYVASDQVYRLRMELASKGIPSGDGVGFEIFDKGQFGLSDFVQRTNYIRALQGELSRTITQLDGVRAARVMIVQPENRLLLTDQNVKPTASVFVELSAPRLDTEAVNSIRHLVANAVQGLVPDQVAVVDQRGRVLSDELKQDPTLGTASSQMRYRQQVEDYLAKKVESMLLPVVGTGNAIVRVSAEIETESTVLTQEKFDPEGQVIRTQTQNEDISNSVESRRSGAVGVTANTPDKAGVAANAEGAGPTTSSEQNRKTRTTSYEINRSITNVTRSPGTIKTVTAAVFVAQRFAAAPAGAPAGTAPTPQPRTPEEIAALRNIVINALGLRPAPGQTPEQLVSLQETTFQVEPIAEQVAQIQSETRIQSWLDVGSRYLAVAVAAIVLMMFWKMLGRQKPEAVPMELLTAAPETPQRAFESKGGVLSPELLNELIKQKPANIGSALRDWVAVKKN